MRNPTAAIAAESAIFGEVYPRLRRFAAVVAPIEVDPDDVVQDALERTLRKRTLASLESPHSYLCRVILNLSSNHRRRLALRRRTLPRLAVEDHHLPSYPSDVEVLMQLGARDRAILYLSELEGYTYGEIAGLLGISEAAAAKAAKRARDRLSLALNKESS